MHRLRTASVALLLLGCPEGADKDDPPDTDDTDGQDTDRLDTDTDGVDTDTDGADTDTDGVDTDAVHTDTAVDTGLHTGDSGLHTGDTAASGPTLATFACPVGGVRVPTDQPTITAALALLDATPGGGTICLGPGTHTEWVQWHFTDEPIVLQGEGADVSTLGGVQSFSMHANEDVTVRGLTVEPPWSSSGNGSVHLHDVRALSGLAIRNNGDTDLETVVLERAEVTSSSGGGLSVDASNPGLISANTFHVTVRNCWLHAAGTGTVLQARNGNTGANEVPDHLSYTFEHNTIEGGREGVRFNGYATGGTMWATFRHNVVRGADTGFTVSIAHNAYDDQVRVTTETNAFFGNGADYGTTTAYAGPSATDVLADCGMDASSPPVPSATGPCADQSSTSLADDFFGQPRSSPADLGAVEIATP